MSQSQTETLARCPYCGMLYLKEKIALHIQVCASKPKAKSIKEAVRRILESGDVDYASLVRLVWREMDGYITPEPPKELTSPWSIVREAYRFKQKAKKAKRRRKK